MRPWLTVALVVLLPPVASAQGTIQEILLRAKPAVAMVVAEVGGEVTVRCGPGGEQSVRPTPFRETGTGWFVDPRGALLTNAHLVSSAHQPPAWVAKQLAENAVQQRCPPAAQASALQTARVKLEPSLFVILSNGIRLPAVIAKYSPPVLGVMSGRDLALLRLEAADMPTLALGDSAAAKIGDRLHILGFPGVVLSHELLNASAKVEASVTNGAVSGFKQDVANQAVIQTDASAAPGISGGPTVNDRGNVVGVLTLAPGDQSGAVQGFNFVIPSAAVREFLKDTPVARPEPSRFNAAWHAALRDFFAGNHPAARKHFAEANRLLPEIPDVRRLSEENEDRIKNPPPRPFPWLVTSIAVLLVGGGAFAVYWGRRWQRNRFRIRPSEVMRLVEEAPEPPLILDVRDDQTYEKSPVRIPKSLHLTPQALEGGEAALPVEPTRTVVAYCT